MANDTIITIVGNLTADPEVRYTRSGIPVANFTIASTPRAFDRQANEWKDGDALFLRSTIWRDFAEHVAGSLSKGMRVVAQGRLVQRSYTDRDGNNRTSVELEVDEIGPSLRYATADVTRIPASGSERGRAGTNRQPGNDQRGAGGFVPQNGSSDGWAAPDEFGDDTPF